MNRALSTPLPRSVQLGWQQKAALSVEVVYAYARVRLLMRRADLPRTLLAVRRSRVTNDAISSDEAVELGQRLARVTVRTLTPIPSDTRCLMRALTLTALLSRRGLVTTLVMSVRRGADFEAHAWVEYDGIPLLPPGDARHDKLVVL